jgi:hypothetical protein
MVTSVELENLKGRTLFERFQRSIRWDEVSVSSYRNMIYSAIFREVNNGKYVFVSVGHSNSGRTEYWSFNEKLTGSFYLSLFNASSDWNEINYKCHSARNDHDSRTSSYWVFQNKAGKTITITSRSTNRSGNSDTYTFEGDQEDIPEYSCLYQ